VLKKLATKCRQLAKKFRQPGESAAGGSKGEVKMKLTFSNKYKGKALATFCTRVTFDDAYRRADGETEEERKEMAYRILAALADVETCFEEAGISPW
jgi:hypothetical protein